MKVLNFIENSLLLLMQIVYYIAWFENLILKLFKIDKRDSMLVAQQGQDWWGDFNSTMKVINQECEKIL